MHFANRWAVFSLLALSASATAVACGGDDDVAPASGGTTSGSIGGAGHGGSSAGGKAAQGGAAGTGGSAGAAHAGSGGTKAGEGGSAQGGREARGGAGHGQGATGNEGGEAGTGGTTAEGGTGGESGSGATAGEAGSAGAEAVELTELEKTLAAELSPLPELPADTTNAYADNADAAALGQMFFFEKSYSGALADLGMDDQGHPIVNDLGAAGETGKIACASCHAPGGQFSDTRSSPTNVSLGANYHTRNAPGIVNSAYYKWTNWGGRFDAPWELPLAVTENAAIMNSNRLRLAHVIFDKYRAEYDAVFSAAYGALPDSVGALPADGKPKASGASDGAWEGLSSDDQALVNRMAVNFGKALEAYFRKLVSKNSRFDAFVAHTGELTDAELRGLKVFLGPGKCTTCHNGPDFTDNAFHNIGVAQTGPHVPATDDGRFKDVPGLLTSAFNSASATYSDDVNTGRLLGLTNPMPDSTKGQFRTPSLRGVAQSAPYMHSGQLATLEDVVDFYNRGGDTPGSGTKEFALEPLGLSAGERADLVAFLGTLTGEAIPAPLLANTAK